MKTLFLKSNLLHIRTNEGEFEVSPECYTKGISRDGENYWYNVDTGTTTVGIGEKEKFEWPGGVELIEVDTVEDGGGCYVAGSKTVARLIPAENKKEHIFIDGDFNNSYESRVRNAKGRKKIKELSNDKMDVYEEGHYLNFQPKDSTESAYKEFDAKPKKCICYDPKECMQFGCQYPGPVESPEPQEKEHDCEFFLVTDVSVYACECDPHHILIDNQEYVAINKITKANPVSAPYESQEEIIENIQDIHSICMLNEREQAISLISEQYVIKLKHNGRD